MSNPSLAIVVAEDDRHKMLAYRYLKKRGLSPRIEVSPSGRGSAENWVRKRFAKEVSVYRRRHAQTALIVMIDADTGTVEDRLRQLAEALREAGEPPIDTKTERIARMVPKRNVETWILCLNGHAVNEEDDYTLRPNWSRWVHHADWSKWIPPGVETLVDWTQSKDEPPNHCVDSLRSCINELRRLRF